MTSTEKKAVFTLASIMSLRMIGLFMVLPVFTLYATGLKYATPFLVGISIGIYGLFQALFQIPFGTLSDRLGRKPVILIGLVIFAIGSFIAAQAPSIYLMIFGRALQGIGAIGSTILAAIADLTREDQRTKSMAITGITIGLSFSLAMLIGPLLTKWLLISDLFYAAMFLSFIAIMILYFFVPHAETHFHRDTTPELKSLAKLFTTPELAKLNVGILILHAVFTASFIVIPINFYESLHFAANEQWLIFLPSLLIAAIISLFCIGLAERKHQIKAYFLGGIITLALSTFLLWLASAHLILSAIGLCLFFASFSLLEAFLPSLISRTAPVAQKGSALGIYSCSQFFGIFIGGLFGGWLYGTFSFGGVYLFCITLSLFWFILAYRMQAPSHLMTQMIRLAQSHPDTTSSIAQLKIIPGMIEVTFIAEDGIVYLKMARTTVKHPDFIRLREQLQSETHSETHIV